MKKQLARVQALLDREKPNPGKALKTLRPLAKQKTAPWPVFHFMGIAYIHKNDFKTALKWLRKSVRLGADEPETWHSISICHYNMRAFDKAVEFEKQALEKREDSFKGWLHLGSIYRAQAKLDEALDCYKKADRIQPDNIHIAYRIGRIYQDQGNLKKALELFDFTLKKKPDYDDIKAAKAEVLKDMGRFDEAEVCLQAILEHQPKYLRAHLLLGELYRVQGKYKEAIEFLEQSIEETPGIGALQLNLATYKQEIGRYNESEQHFLRVLENQPEENLSLSGYLMALHYNPERSKEEIFEAHKQWDQYFAPAKRPERPVPQVKERDKKLRIGFLSGGFRRHPVGWMITQGLEHLPGEQLETFCYTTAKTPDSLTKRIIQATDKWQSVAGYNEEIIARMIREDEIDILVELSGHGADNRLRTVALEPAPVIAKWVGGLFNTTGLQSVDYLITDRHETPAGEEPFYTEKLVRMPDDYICFMPPDYAPDVGPLPAKENGYITFGCFNNPAKVNNEILEQWAVVMNRVPDSRLFLKSKQYDTEILRERIIKKMEKCGVSEDRLIFEGQSKHQILLDCYNRVDIALDPWPYSGGLTTCEALWMGVPVVTKPGPTFAGRHSTTHLINAGFSEWVADSWEEYIETVVSLAKDTETLAEIRSDLRTKVASSPVCDGKRFGAHLAAAFREMWKQRVEGYEKDGAEGKWQDHIEVKALSEEEIEATAAERVPAATKSTESANIADIAHATEELVNRLEEEERTASKNTQTNGAHRTNSSGNAEVHKNGTATSTDQHHNGQGMNSNNLPVQNGHDQETYKIETKDGVTICTPGDLSLLTPYVLLEQEQWYEPELAFVRDYLEPGMNMLDVGAGFGAYALPMAKLAGEEGTVYAFEPGSVARRHLEMSKLENRAGNLEVIGRAVADQPGKAKLQVADTPELNKLDKNGTEEVSQTTLDAWWEFEGRPDIDFIKLDVNGYEAKVLAGAETLLSETSPVILLAIGEEEQKSATAMERLQDKGYRLYEYVSGPQVLTPYHQADRDSYLMNIIAIKEEQTEAFRISGWLYDEATEPRVPETGLWKKTLRPLPWTQSVFAGWEQSRHKNYLQALDFLCAAEQVDLNATGNPALRSEKAALMLHGAGELIQIYNSGNTDIPIALSLARVLNALGKRSQAVEIIKKVMEDNELGQQDMKMDLPFLLPLPEQDQAPINTNFAGWLTVRVTEAWVLMKDATTYLSGGKEKRLLKVLEGNPENRSSIERRIKLLKQQIPNDSVTGKDESDEVSKVGLSSGNTHRPLFIHLFFNNIHTQSILETLEQLRKTDKYNHVAFVEVRRSMSAFTVDLSKLSFARLFSKEDLTGLLNLTSKLNPAVIIVHGLFFPWQKEFIEKVQTDAPIYWSIWGGDLYNPIKIGNPLHDLTQRISGVITKVDGDYELFEETYGKKHRIKSFSFGVSSKINVDEISKITPRRIIVGNSGDPSNNHIQVLKILSQKKDIQNYQLHIPFTHSGSNEYLNAVKKAVRDHGLENITTFQTKFIPKKQYNTLLMESSYLICAHERQQALSTISSSLYYGNIVFIRKQIKKADGNIGINPTWRPFCKLGSAVQSLEGFTDADRISDYTFPDKETLKNTRERLSVNYDIQESAKLLKKGFDEIIKHNN